MAGPGARGRAQGLREGHSLQHVAVELLLAVAQELSDHLPAEALPLQKEVGHSDGGIRDEASRDQELDTLVWVSASREKGYSEPHPSSPRKCPRKNSLEMQDPFHA